MDFRGLCVRWAYYLWKKKNRQSFYSWKMDETYIKIKGRWHYLYRAIGSVAKFENQTSPL